MPIDEDHRFIWKRITYFAKDITRPEPAGEMIKFLAKKINYNRIIKEEIDLETLGLLFSTLDQLVEYSSSDKDFSLKNILTKEDATGVINTGLSYINIKEDKQVSPLSRDSARRIAARLTDVFNLKQH